MPAQFRTEGGVLWAEKPAAAELDFTLQWDGLDAGDEIATSVWTVPPGLVLGDESRSDRTTTAFLAGGTGGTWYQVANTITTAGGRTDQQTFRIYINPLPDTLGAGIISIFGNLPTAVASLRRDRLATALENYAPGSTVSDEYLLEKLVSAEKAIERDLRVFFTPREIVTPSTTQAERDALIAAGNVLVEEPGYDWDPALFQGNTWGLIDLRNRPAISVSRIGFYYPAPVNLVYEVPIEWVRLEKRLARINLVPTQTVLAVPLNAYILSALGGGRTVPLMLHIRYRAGMENAAVDYPDLLSVIRRQAVLDILSDRFVPSSGSVSADGLSQSISFEAEKYQEGIDKKLASLRTSLHGPRIMVM